MKTENTNKETGIIRYNDAPAAVEEYPDFIVYTDTLTNKMRDRINVSDNISVYVSVLALGKPVIQVYLRRTDAQLYSIRRFDADIDENEIITIIKDAINKLSGEFEKQAVKANN